MVQSGYGLNYIAGQFTEGTDGSIPVFNPADRSELALQACAGPDQVSIAIEAAARVHNEGALRYMPPEERGEKVRRVGLYLLANLEEIKESVSLEQGKPLFEAEAEVRMAARLFEYFGSNSESLEGKSVPTSDDRFDFTTFEPYGVSAQFMPSHYPIYIPARALSVALTAGNACVMKTSELAPLSTSWISKAIHEAEFPKGSVSIFCGRREVAGLALAESSQIDHVVFVGNKESASEVLSKTSIRHLPSVVEVGGTSPTIFFEDGDVDTFVDEARMGTFWNAGQFCCGMYRILVHESRLSEVTEASVNLARSIEVGPGVEREYFSPYMGPLDSNEQLGRVLGVVEDAKNKGAEVLTGGKKLNMGGFFMAPTVIHNVDKRMMLAKEEVFGPVMGIISFQTESEAISLANSASHSGLMCGVFTNDLSKMLRTAKLVNAGHIVANQTAVGSAEVPFGGFGGAGHGSLKGREALLGFVQRKNIMLNITGR